MIAQKELFIPTVNTVQVSDFDASVNFTTDYIEFPNSTKDWSVQFFFSNPEAATTSEVSILVSNSFDSEYFPSYLPYKPSVNQMVMDSENWLVFDNIMPFRYMKIAYTANDNSGTMSIVITK